MSKKLVTLLLVMITTLLVPLGSHAIVGEDGSIWVQVNQPGFGSDNNLSVVAMAEYNGYLYAMTRSEAESAEVWRTSGTGWEQVLFPGGETNGIYGNDWINNVWGKMIVFQNKLYFGFSSGLQGNYLGSTGCEIWRYDGTTWEPVISDKKDTDESGGISAISGCTSGDGNTTAQINDSSKSWSTDHWAGGVLQITSGDGNYRHFKIISNTQDTLTIQQNEVAGTGKDQASETEFTICASKKYDNPFPSYSYTLGEVKLNDTYEIGMGSDENGFGDVWNKTITDMTIFNDALYVSTGLNYEYGAQVWYTADGDNWTVTQPTNSFGNFHPSTTYPNSQKPVSTSIPNLCVSSVSGSPVFYAGGTGSSGTLGSCSRMAKLTDTGWELIVDVNVDTNSTGTNENGFGDGMSCAMETGNFMPWSLADFGSKLYVGINSLGGARVLYSPNGSSEDGNWFFSVGGDSGIPNGFDGLMNGGFTSYQNIAVNLFPFGSYLYAGIVSTFVPEYGATEKYVSGSHIWKSSDGSTWEKVTDRGFGDTSIVNFEAFTVFNGTLYVSGSKGASSTPAGLGGAKIFRQVVGLTGDDDGDGFLNAQDNCPTAPNGPNEGLCTSGYSGVACHSNSECGSGGFCSMNQEDTDGDGVGNVCDNCSALQNPSQEDTYPPAGNGIGDLCDCEANFDCDTDVDAQDVTAFLADFGRSIYNQPCTNLDPCKGDFSCDGDVDATDVTKFLEDFGRSQYNKPCPVCVMKNWCKY